MFFINLPPKRSWGTTGRFTLLTNQLECVNNEKEEASMNPQILAIIFQEGGRIVTELIRTHPLRRVAAIEPPVMEEIAKQPEEELEEALAKPNQEKATAVETGCVPCAIGHFGTCSGLLNEAMRFAKKEGVESTEVIDRMNICMDELNALERVDLRPELITNLPDWEKKLANKALTASRGTRHGLENLTSVETLEKVAANTQSARQEIGREWFKERLARMSPEEKEKVAKKAMERLGKEE